MKLLTAEIRKQMIENFRRQEEAAARDKCVDHRPVVKLFTPDAGATWLLTELDPDGEDLAFGLCDLGMGEPELGYVSISELATVRGRMGLPVERDLHFTADKTLSEYAEEARKERRIRA